MKHGNCLAESVLLKDPSGAEWRIELTRSEGEVWLEKGWPEFAKFYSLDHGYLLVFSCEGDFSCFQVRIFNRNTMEIDYPMKPSHGVMEELEDDDASVEILDSVPAKRRGRTELASLWPRKTMRTKSGDKAKVKSYPSGETKDQAMKHHREKRSYGSPSSRKSCEGMYGIFGFMFFWTSFFVSFGICHEVDCGYYTEDGGSMPTALTSLEANEHSVDTRDGAYLRATSFKYNNPFLVVRMQESYIKKCLVCFLNYLLHYTTYSIPVCMRYKFMSETGCGQWTCLCIYFFVFSVCRKYKESLQRHIFVQEEFAV